MRQDENEAGDAVHRFAATNARAADIVAA